MGGSSSKYSAKTTALEVLNDFPGTVQGKVCIVTGGNAGIGLETCRILAIGGARVILCSRSVESAERVVQGFKSESSSSTESRVPVENIVIKQLDLESLPSIKRFADDVLQESSIDILVCNAGIMALPEAQYNNYGWERQIATNHIGHFYLTSLLLPKMEAQETKSRVVVLASTAHLIGKIDLNDIHFKNGRKYGSWAAYGQSKLANVLFAKSLADKYRGRNISAVSVNPGNIHTNLIQHSELKEGFTHSLYKTLIVNKNIPQGAATTIWACVTPDIESISGAYLNDCGVATASSGYHGYLSARGEDRDGSGRRMLWEYTEKELNAALTSTVS